MHAFWSFRSFLESLLCVCVLTCASFEGSLGSCFMFRVIFSASSLLQFGFERSSHGCRKLSSRVQKFVGGFEDTFGLRSEFYLDLAVSGVVEDDISRSLFRASFGFCAVFCHDRRVGGRCRRRLILGMSLAEIDL